MMKRYEIAVDVGYTFLRDVELPFIVKALDGVVYKSKNVIGITARDLYLCGASEEVLDLGDDHRWTFRLGKYAIEVEDE